MDSPSNSNACRSGFPWTKKCLLTILFLCLGKGVPQAETIHRAFNAIDQVFTKIFSKRLYELTGKPQADNTLLYYLLDLIKKSLIGAGYKELSQNEMFEIDHVTGRKNRRRLCALMQIACPQPDSILTDELKAKIEQDLREFSKKEPSDCLRGVRQSFYREAGHPYPKDTEKQRPYLSDISKEFDTHLKGKQAFAPQTTSTKLGEAPSTSKDSRKRTHDGHDKEAEEHRRGLHIAAVSLKHFFGKGLARLTNSPDHTHLHAVVDDTRIYLNTIVKHAFSLKCLLHAPGFRPLLNCLLKIAKFSDRFSVGCTKVRRHVKDMHDGLQDYPIDEDSINVYQAVAELLKSRTYPAAEEFIHVLKYVYAACDALVEAHIEMRNGKQISTITEQRDLPSMDSLENFVHACEVMDVVYAKVLAGIPRSSGGDSARQIALITFMQTQKELNE